MKEKWLLLFFLLPLFIYRLDAQDRGVFFQNLREEVGLNYHIVNDIHQDSIGRLWLATYNGVYSYDGYDFKNIRHAPSLSNSISSNLCTEIYVDPQQHIWVGSNDNGLSVMIPERDTVIRISNQLLSIEEKFSKQILEIDGSTGTSVFVLTNVGVFKLDWDDYFQFQSTNIPLPLLIKPSAIRCMQFHEGVLWIGSRSGMMAYNIQTQKWLTTENDPLLLKARISSMSLDGNGKIWVGVRNETGVYVLDPRTQKIEPYPGIADMRTASHVHLCHDGERYLWVVAGRQGVYRHDLESKETDYFAGKDYDQKPGNFTNFTQKPIKDKFGNIWFCGGGIHKWSNTGKQFIHYQHPLNAYQATAVIHDDKNYRIQSLWGNGIVVWKKAKDEFYQMKIEKEPLSKNIYAIQRITDHLYLLCGQGGCQHLDASLEKILTTIPIAGTIYDIERDEDQWLLAGSRGLWSLSSSEETEKLFDEKGMRALVLDEERNIWMATINNGLFFWNRKNNETSHFTYQPDKENGIQSNRIEHLDISDDGIIWLATSSGIEQYDPQKKQWKDFRSDQFLAGIRANAVLCLGDSLVWVSNNQGISRYERAKDRWTHFQESDGILNPYFYERVAFQNANGELFFGGRNGVVHFQSNQIKQNNIAPTLFFDQIKIDGESHLINNNQIRMDWRNRFIELHFTGVHLTEPKRLNYAYRLLPLQKEWTPIARQPLFFNGLDYGNYQIEIKALTDDGVESIEPLRLEIWVIPPIWKRWWVWVILVVTFAAFITWLIWRRMNAIKQKNLLEQRMNNLKHDALRAQMNPHFIFNAMSGIQYFIVEGEEVKALKYLAILGKLIRKILDYSHERWISLSQELELIQHYTDLEQLRFNDLLEINIDSPSSNFADEINIPSLLLQPIVENALIHGLRNSDRYPKKINITIRMLNEKMLQIAIEDNGIGMEATAEQKAHAYQSKGNENVLQRMQLVGVTLGVDSKMNVTDLYAEDGLACGTKVEIQIPFKKL